MSAFIVEDVTINNIMAVALSRVQRGSMARIELERLVEQEGPARVGKLLFDMNVEAVRQRYGEQPELDEGYRYSPTVPDVRAGYRSGRCLRYQCSEGDVPETPLYQALNEFVQTIACQLADDLVENMPWR